MLIRVCNCSECGAEIETSWSDDGSARYSPRPKLIKGRPVCDNCMWSPTYGSWQRGGGSGERRGGVAREDFNGSRENAIRALEG
jgi:hypothetical protein